MQHHYYKFTSESPSGTRLTEFITTAAKTEKLAEEYRDRYNADGYMESTMGFSGGVSALIFNKHEVPEHWELVPGTEDIYIPDNEDLFREMLAVPCMPIMPLLAILKPKAQIRSLRKTPTMFLYNGNWYVQTIYELSPDIEDVEIITEKEYFRRQMAYINTQDKEKDEE